MMPVISASAGNNKDWPHHEKVYFISFPCFHLYFAFAQNEIKIYPSNWWVGMKNPHLQLMIHGNNIGRNRVYQIRISGSQNWTAHSKTINPNYLFLDLTIESEYKTRKLLKFNVSMAIQHEFIIMHSISLATWQRKYLCPRHQFFRFYLSPDARPFQQRGS